MSTEKKPEHPKKKLYSMLGAGVLILIGVATVFLTGSNPIAMVGGSFISSREFENRLEVAKRLDSNPNRTQVFDQMVDEKKRELLVRKYNLDLDAIDREVNYYKVGNEQQYNQFVSEYFGGDEKAFNEFVATPEALDALLRIKFNSDFSKNNDAYNKAANVISKLNGGQSFEDLALTTSDDKVTGQFGGDLGFVRQGQLLPELDRVLASAKLGEVKKEVVVSRLGYHILYPVETADQNGQQVWHVRHILVQTQGYENWLANELKQFGVRKFSGI